MVTSKLNRLIGGIRATQRFREYGIRAKQFLEMMQFISNGHHVAIQTSTGRHMTGRHTPSFIE
jgi:hypothetical protein